MGLAVCAVLAGARSHTAVAEWATDADQGTFDALGIRGPSGKSRAAVRRLAGTRGPGARLAAILTR